MLNSYFNTSNVTIQHRCVYGIKAARQISIHLMLLFNFNPNKPCQQWSNFNTSNVTIQLFCTENNTRTVQNFNTSNVTIQLFNLCQENIITLISIHLMLLFNWNLCSSTNNLNLNFNTSNVTIQLTISL